MRWDRALGDIIAVVKGAHTPIMYARKNRRQTDRILGGDEGKLGQKGEKKWGL